jgi:hypothetical protein
MRKITLEACKAFHNGYEYRNNNTEVTSIPDESVTLWLHGNVIARRRFDVPGVIEVTLAGWNTRTTRERLNGLLEHYGFTLRFWQCAKKPIIIDVSLDDDIGVDIHKDDWICIRKDKWIISGAQCSLPLIRE